MLLNYCYWSPRGLRASHNKLFVHCVPRPFRRFPFFRGAAGSRSFSTVLFSRIERAPFGRNGWVIYQNGPSRARGFRQKIQVFSGSRKCPQNARFGRMKLAFGNQMRGNSVPGPDKSERVDAQNPGRGYFPAVGALKSDGRARRRAAMVWAMRRCPSPFG